MDEHTPYVVRQRLKALAIALVPVWLSVWGELPGLVFAAFQSTISRPHPKSSVV